MLAIINTVRDQKIYAKEAKQKIKVLLDYKNLTYFAIAQELSKRQFRQAKLLALYDFSISYIKRTENKRADALSKRLDFITKRENMLRALLIKKDKAYKPNKMLAITIRIKATSKIKKYYNRLVLILEDEKENFNILQHKLRAYKHLGKEKIYQQII